MKILLQSFVLCFCLLSINSDAQMLFGKQINRLTDPEKIEGIVYYKFLYKPDSTRKDSVRMEVLKLAFSKNYSLFDSYSYSKADSVNQDAMSKQIAQQIDAQQGEDKYDLTITSKLNPNSEGSKEGFFTSNKSGQAVNCELREIMSRLFAIKDTSNSIAWDIEDSTKMIGKYLCQKAVATSHGRIYTAWFSTDLPFGFGPRRLSGLPGLILEAYDIRREVVYTLDRVEITSDNIEKVGYPYWAIDASIKDVNRLQSTVGKSNPAVMGIQIGQMALTSHSMFSNVAPSKIKSLSINKSEVANDKTSNFSMSNNPIDLK